MKRRSLLKLGIASGVVLAVAGGSLAMLKPGLAGNKLWQRLLALLGDL